MDYEISCGAVVFTRREDELLFLLIQSKAGYWGFPKGHMEVGERERQTALREIKEEVGLNVALLDGFRTVEEHPLPEKHGVMKRVIYFAAAYENQTFVAQEAEVNCIRLATFDEAMALFQFDSNRRVLREAQTFLASQSQYQNSARLQTRMNLHAKYSTNKQGFFNWLLSHYPIQPQSAWLELGCGTGAMWKGHLPPDGAHLTLTDLSDGMVEAARQNLGEHPCLTYRTANIEAIPYQDGRFDGVIANMMLYHVPDLHQALSEVRRVLKPGGLFYCATNGENSIIPQISRLLGLSIETSRHFSLIRHFSLQSGQALLERYFRQVERIDYVDSLAITNLEDLLDYLQSLDGLSELAAIDRDAMRAKLQPHMVDGVLTIPKEVGTFICRK